MRAAAVIAAKDLRQRFRDRSALVLGFVAPLGIAMLMSSAFSGTENLELEAGYVNDDGGELANAFLAMFDDQDLEDLIELVEVEDEATARRMVDSGEIGVAVVLPREFSAKATSPDPISLRVLASTNARIGGEVMTAIAEGFVSQVNANRLSFAAANAVEPPGERPSHSAVDVSALRIPVQIADEGIGARQLETISYYGPSMGIFFVLFVVGVGARSFFSERTNGTLDRLNAAPIRPAQVLLGKALSVFVYGLASLVTVVTATSLLLGANWGNPIAVAGLCVAMALAVVCLTALVIALARTERQAEGIASMSVFALALVGGNFVVAAEMPPGLRKLALATPNGWALRGFSDLAVGIDAIDAVALPMGAMLAFCAVTGGAAALLARRLAHS